MEIYARNKAPQQEMFSHIEEYCQRKQTQEQFCDEKGFLYLNSSIG